MTSVVAVPRWPAPAFVGRQQGVTHARPRPPQPPRRHVGGIGRGSLRCTTNPSGTNPHPQPETPGDQQTSNRRKLSWHRGAGGVGGTEAAAFAAGVGNLYDVAGPPSRGSHPPRCGRCPPAPLRKRPLSANEGAAVGRLTLTASGHTA